MCPNICISRKECIYVYTHTKNEKPKTNLNLQQHKEAHSNEHSPILAHLQAFRTWKSLTHSPEVNSIYTERHSLQVSRFSSELFIAFLFDHKMLGVLSLLNRSISFNIRESQDALWAKVPASTTQAMAQTTQPSEKVCWGVQDEVTACLQLMSPPAVYPATQKPLEKETRKVNTFEVPPTHSSFWNDYKSQVLIPLGSILKSRREAHRIPQNKRMDMEHDLQVAKEKAEKKKDEALDFRQAEKRLKESKKEIPAPTRQWPSVLMVTALNGAQDITCMDATHDASSVVCGFSNSRTVAWTSNYPRFNSSPDKVLGRGGQAGIAHAGSVYETSMHPLGEEYLSCSEDGTVRLWSKLLQNPHQKDALWNNLVVFPVSRGQAVWDVCFAPFGHYFVCAGEDRLVRLFAVDKVAPLRVFVGHLSDVDCVAWHPNVHYVASGSSDKSVRVWDVLTGKCVRVFQCASEVTQLSFDPTGRFLASATQQGLVQVWDLDVAVCVSGLHGHTSPVHALSWAPLQTANSRDTLSTGDSFSNNVSESYYLVSGSLDGELRMWDIKAILDSKTKLVMD